MRRALPRSARLDGNALGHGTTPGTGHQTSHRMLRHSARYSTAGPAGISPSPSQRCVLVIHENGINTGPRANKPLTPILERRDDSSTYCPCSPDVYAPVAGNDEGSPVIRRGPMFFFRHVRLNVETTQETCFFAPSCSIHNCAPAAPRAWAASFSTSCRRSVASRPASHGPALSTNRQRRCEPPPSGRPAAGRASLPRRSPRPNRSRRPTRLPTQRRPNSGPRLPRRSKYRRHDRNRPADLLPREPVPKAVRDEKPRHPFGRTMRRHHSLPVWRPS